MVDQIQKIVTELPDLENVTGVWAVADGWVAQGDAVSAADLGIALAKTYGSREQNWYGFEANTKWFEQVAWDVGLAALTPDRRRLLVLASTDTD